MWWAELVCRFRRSRWPSSSTLSPWHGTWILGTSSTRARRAWPCPVSSPGPPNPRAPTFARWEKASGHSRSYNASTSSSRGWASWGGVFLVSVKILFRVIIPINPPQSTPPNVTFKGYLMTLNSSNHFN